MTALGSYPRVADDGVNRFFLVAVLGIGLRTFTVLAAPDEVHEPFLIGRFAVLAAVIACWPLLKLGHTSLAIVIASTSTAIYVVLLTLRSGNLGGEPFIMMVAFLIVTVIAAPKLIAQVIIVACSVWVAVAATLIWSGVVPGRDFVSEPSVAGSLSYALAVVFLAFYCASALRYADRLATKLERSSTELEAMMFHAPIGIATLDADGCVMHSNIALRQMLLLPDEIETGVHFDVLTHHDQAAPLHRVIRKALAGDTTASPSTVRFEQPGGRWLELQVNMANVDAHDGSSFVMLTIEDVSEVRRLEREREVDTTSRSLGLLAGGIAHDFNNVLAAVQAHAMVANERYRRGESVDQNLDRVIEGTEHASMLTRQLLAYARNDERIVEPLTVNTVVGDAVELVRPALPKVTLRCEFGDDLPDVHGDATRLHQVVMNLIINASKASDGEDEEVRLATSLCVVHEANRADWAIGVDLLQDGEYVQIEVQDDGRGIATESVERIFDPFYSTNPEGHGLGLAVVLDIVRSHGGAVRVRSELDHGTSVSVLLPSIGMRDVG